MAVLDRREFPASSTLKQSALKRGEFTSQKSKRRFTPRFWSGKPLFYSTFTRKIDVSAEPGMPPLAEFCLLEKIDVSADSEPGMPSNNSTLVE